MGSMIRDEASAGLDTLGDEELLQRYEAAMALKRLHSEKGGLRQSRKHYEERMAAFRNEILRRMSGRGS